MSKKIYELYGSDQRVIDNLKRKIRGYEKMKKDITSQNRKVNNQNRKLQQENKKYKEVINELRNYLKARIEVCDNKLSTPFWDIENTTKERLILSQCLEKLEELEVEHE